MLTEIIDLTDLMKDPLILCFVIRAAAAPVRALSADRAGFACASSLAPRPQRCM